MDNNNNESEYPKIAYIDEDGNEIDLEQPEDGESDIDDNSDNEFPFD